MADAPTQREFVVGQRRDRDAQFLEHGDDAVAYAEPLELLNYLHHGPDGTPALRHAWRTLLENSPHDSICGCSVDQTHKEMFPRYDRAEQLAQQVAKESMWHIAGRVDVPAPGGLAVLRVRRP